MKETNKLSVEELADNEFFKLNADPYYNGRLNKAEFNVGFKAGYAASQATVKKIGDGRIVFNGETYVNEKSGRVMSASEFNSKTATVAPSVSGDGLKVRNDIAEILKENIYHSDQAHGYVIHGAIEKIIEYFRKPVSGKEVEEDFKDYMREARDEFVLSVKNEERSNFLLTAIDSFLICFDQMRERLLSSSPLSNVDAVAFYEWVEDSPYYRKRNGLFQDQVKRDVFYTTAELYTLFQKSKNK